MFVCGQIAEIVEVDGRLHTAVVLRHCVPRDGEEPRADGPGGDTVAALEQFHHHRLDEIVHI
jgi:hypothetical protein